VAHFQGDAIALALAPALTESPSAAVYLTSTSSTTANANRPRTHLAHTRAASHRGCLASQTACDCFAKPQPHRGGR